MSKLIKLFTLVLSLNIFAQQENLKINGNITDSKQNNITSAEIYLFTANNELVKTTIVQDGNFEFSQLKPAQYHLQIVSNDITHNEPPFQLSSDLNLSVMLNEKVSNIEEIKISRTRNPFKVQNGNIDIDVANSSLSKVATSTDLLAKLPFIYVDANGEGLSLVGKGIPLLYIDNQKFYFNVLSAVSVDEIKSVEIIRNPSAKYEAEGKSVVKVILKNSRKEGYKLALNETAVFNKRFSNNFSANFQQKKNNTEWKLNAVYNQIQHWESNGFDYSVPGKNIKSDYIIMSMTNRPQVILGASLYHELNDGDNLTFTINGNLRPDKGDNNTITNYEVNGLKSQILTLNPQDRKRATINSIFNYNKQLKSINATIFTGLQYTRESNNVDLDFYNNIDNSGYSFSQFRKQKYAVNAFSGRIDIEKEIKKN